MLGSRVRSPQTVPTLNRSQVYVYVPRYNTAFRRLGGRDKCLGHGCHDPRPIPGSEISYKNIRMRDTNRKIVAIGPSDVETNCKVQGKTATTRYNTKHQSDGEQSEQRVRTDNRPPNVRTPHFSVSE